MRIEYLPPYSPDFNPIEQAFSVMKARMCRDGNIFRAVWNQADDLDVYLRLYDLVFSITADNARGFYAHSRYVSL